MPQDVQRHAIPDGEYTLQQIQSNSHLSVLLPSAGPDGYVTVVEGGWARAELRSPSKKAQPEPVPASQDDDLSSLSYYELKKLAYAKGYPGGSRKAADLLEYLKSLEA